MERFFRHTKANAMRRTAIPPTTLPMMAPIGGELSLAKVGISVGAVLDTGIV